MQTKVGIDISRKNRFIKSLKTGGQSFLDRLFLPQEIRQNTPDQLASVFSVKEAVIKALELSQDSWLKISTNRQDNGKLSCSFLDSNLASRIASLDTSLSHDGEWIIAVAVVNLS